MGLFDKLFGTRSQREIKKLQPIAEQKWISVYQHIQFEGTIDCLGVHLRHAISNLVENAIKYNKENGWVRVILDADHKFFYVKVSDSGMGIPADSIDYIFERFYKEDSSRSVHTRGAGIGLYISKTLVQRSGGDIWAESEEGQYTEFIFTLPCAKQSSPKVNIPTGAITGRGKNRKNKRQRGIYAALPAIFSTKRIRIGMK